MTTMHPGITLDYLEERVRAKGEAQDLVTVGDTPLSLHGALATILTQRAMGYVYWPSCDNVGSDGHCVGHESFS